MSRGGNTGHIPGSYAARTEVGNVREHNEDSLLAKSPLFVVADGMGGHEAGEVASEIAISVMAERIPDGPDAKALAEAVCEANRAVLRGAQDGTGRPGMGTTMTAALVYGDRLTIAQVGDSRAYLLHEGSLQRVTRDHSLVADLVAQGRITEAEARVHPQRSVITRALGSDPAMQPDTYRMHVERGDRLLLCSDGLSGMLDDEAIESILITSPDPESAVDSLVDEALAAGGLDNVTAIVVDPLEGPGEGGSGGGKGLSRLRGKGKGGRGKGGSGGGGSRGKRNLAPLAWALAFIAIVAVAIGGFWTFAQNSWYLASDDGYVTLYQGLPGELFGVSLSWEVEETDIDTSLLAPTTASRLERGISVDSLEEAEAQIEEYRETVEEAEEVAGGGK